MPAQVLAPADSNARRRVLLAFALALITFTAIPDARAWTDDTSAKAWARRKPKAGFGQASLKYRPLVAAKTHKHDVSAAAKHHPRVYRPRSTGYNPPRPRSESRRHR